MDENKIYLKDLIKIVSQNLRRILLISMAFLVLAAAYLIVTAPVYESQSLLRIKQPQGIGNSLLDAVPIRGEGPTNQLMSTYAEILKSRSVIEPVMEAGGYQAAGVSYETFVKESVMTMPIKNTEIMRVVFYADSPDAAKKANELSVEGFLSRLNELSRTEQRLTKEFISERVSDAQKELFAAESALQAFKENNKFIEPAESMKAIGSRVSWIDQGIAESSVNLAAAQARLAAINSQLDSSGAAISDSATIKLYNQKLAELEMKKASYAGLLTEKNPNFVTLNNDIANTRKQLDSEIKKVASLQAPSDNLIQQNLIAGKLQSEAEIAVASAKAEAMAKIEVENAKQIETMPGLEQGYLRLARNANVAQEIYIMLAKRLEEAKVAEAMAATEVQVLDKPTYPQDPVRPKKALTLFIALVAGLLFGTGYTVVIALLNRTIKTHEEVEGFLKVPVIGTIPDISALNGNSEAIEAKQSMIEKLRRFVKNE